MKDMRNSNEVYRDKNLDYDLHKDYVVALKDDAFKALVTRLKITEEVAMKYTSKLERTVQELNNCKSCKRLSDCKNNMIGCVNYPKVEGSRLRFDYVACKYKMKDLEEERLSSNTFEEPLAIKNARMKDIFLDDKKRMHIIRYVKKFIRITKKSSY